MSLEGVVLNLNHLPPTDLDGNPFYNKYKSAVDAAVVQCVWACMGCRFRTAYTLNSLP